MLVIYYDTATNSLKSSFPQSADRKSDALQSVEAKELKMFPCCGLATQKHVIETFQCHHYYYVIPPGAVRRVLGPTALALCSN